MATTDLTIRLLGDSSGADDAFKSARESALAMERAFARQRREEDILNAESERQAEARNEVMQAGAEIAVGVGIALVGAYTVAAKASTEFESAISDVGSASGATGKELDSLRQLALQTGRDTAFGSVEAAAGIEELSKAGLSATDIIGGGLAGATDLAAASGLGLGEAAETVAITLKQFNLEGDRATNVADALAAGANKAVGDVSELREALAQSGQVAESFGIPMEDAVGALSAFAEAGLLGSDAGTSFKTMLTRLNPTTQEAKLEMERLNISAFDSQGNFKGLAAVAQNLQDSMRNLTPEQRAASMAIIFGSDAVRASNILYEQGAVGITEWTASVSESGFAADQAAAKLDDLEGDLEALGGSFETLLIGFGSAGQGPLRAIVQDVTTVVTALSELPEGVQSTVATVSLATGSVALLGGAAVLAVPQLVSFWTALGAIGPAGLKAQAGLLAARGALAGPLGVALAAATVGLAVFGYSTIQAKQRQEELRGTLDKTTGALSDQTRALAVQEFEDNAAQFEKYGISLTTVTDAALGNAAALDVLRAKRQELNEEEEKTEGPNIRRIASDAQKFEILTNVVFKYAEGVAVASQKTREAGIAMAGTGNAADAFAGYVAYGASVMGEAGTAADGLSGALEGTGEEALSAEDRLNALSDTLDLLISQAFGYETAQDALTAAVNRYVEETAAAIAENGAVAASLTAVDEKTGRLTDSALANREALRGIVGAATEVIDELAKTGASTSDLRDRNGELEAQLGALIEEFGLSQGETAVLRQEIDRYIGTLDAVPDAVATNIGADNAPAMESVRVIEARYGAIDGRTLTSTITADTSAADRALDAWSNRLQGMADSYARLNVPAPAPRQQTSKGGAKKFSKGGYVDGPGTSTSDDVLVRVSTGEYVVTAAAVDSYGLEFLEAVNSRQLPVPPRIIPEMTRSGVTVDGGRSVTSRPSPSGSTQVSAGGSGMTLNIAQTFVNPRPERASDNGVFGLRTAVAYLGFR